jgi:NAD(P)H-hydrate epimerase
MVARAALRAGAGLATIATWTESADAIEAGVLEAMTTRIDRASIAAAVDAALAGKRVAVVGPGLGLDADARAVVERALAFTGVVVVDADALSIFAGSPESFAPARAAILTPHPGEAARLLGTTPAAVEGDRFAAARSLAARARAVVVLKGARTIVAGPDGRVVVNATGNAALATAGSGDVLGGIIAALACSLAPFEAAAAGAFLHWLAADAWSATHGDRGLLASEIADALPVTMRALREPPAH